MSIQKFFTSRSQAEGNLFVGQEGRLWFDSATHIIYYSDGVTPGGIPLTGGGNITITGSTYSNANVASYLPIYSGNITAGAIYTNNYFYANGQPFSGAGPSISSITVTTDSGERTITSNVSIVGGTGITTSMTGNVVTINATPIANTFEALSKNIKSYPYALVRTGSTITSIQYTTPSTDIITKTFNYTSGKISSISITGVPLANVVYTKTLAYSGADITGASYTIV